MFDDFPTCLTHSSTDPKITNLPHPPSVIFLEKTQRPATWSVLLWDPHSHRGAPGLPHRPWRQKRQFGNGAGRFFMFEVLQIFCKVSYPLVI